MQVLPLNHYDFRNATQKRKNAKRTQQAAPTPHAIFCVPSPRPSCTTHTTPRRATTLATERHMNQAARAPNSIQQATRETTAHTHTRTARRTHKRGAGTYGLQKSARRRATQVDFQHKHMMHTCTHKHHAGLPLNHYDFRNATQDARSKQQAPHPHAMFVLHHRDHHANNPHKTTGERRHSTQKDT